MLKKVNQKFEYNKKRNFKLITPCCKRSNKDGKFINYIDLPEIYGFCHSCGKNSLPPTLYTDKKNNLYYWNNTLNKFEAKDNNSIEINKLPIIETHKKESSIINYIPETEIWKKYCVNNENNLLKYLRKIYGNKSVDAIKEDYIIGTSHDGGTIFWSINKYLKVQKSKISYYNTDGKRTDKFKVPYKNEDGYYSCLFGEHLIDDKQKGFEKYILVESEKTALVGAINFPKYSWLAFGGINGLTDSKLKPLTGHRILIIPDISSKAVDVINKKISIIKNLNINVKIWDMTEGKTDNQLKKEGIYNNDLEDFLRNKHNNEKNV